MFLKRNHLIFWLIIETEYYQILKEVKCLLL